MFGPLGGNWMMLAKTYMDLKNDNKLAVQNVSFFLWLNTFYNFGSMYYSCKVVSRMWLWWYDRFEEPEEEEE